MIMDDLSGRSITLRVIVSLLGIRSRAAVFEISRFGNGEAGRLVEDSIGWYRVDRHKYAGNVQRNHG